MREPNEHEIEKAREYLKTIHLENALHHLIEFDNGMRISRIIESYKAIDVLEAGQVLFDILDATQEVDDLEAYSKAKEWIEYA